MDGFDVAFLNEVRTANGTWWQGDSTKEGYDPNKVVGDKGQWRDEVPETQWSNNAVPRRPSNGLATQEYVDHHLGRVLLDDAPAAPALPQVYDEALSERLSLADRVLDADNANFATSFSEPNLLAGWAKLDPNWVGSYGKALDPAATEGAYLRQVNSTRARKHLVWLAAGQHADCIVRSKVKADPVAPGANPDTAVGVMGRVSADGPTGYYAALSRAGGVRALRVGKYVEGVATNLQDVPFDWLDGQWYWIEMSLQGTSIRARAWKDGDPQP